MKMLSQDVVAARAVGRGEAPPRTVVAPYRRFRLALHAAIAIEIGGNAAFADAYNTLHRHHRFHGASGERWSGGSPPRVGSPRSFLLGLPTYRRRGRTVPYALPAAAAGDGDGGGVSETEGLAPPSETRGGVRVHEAGRMRVRWNFAELCRMNPVDIGAIISPLGEGMSEVDPPPAAPFEAAHGALPPGIEQYRRFVDSGGADARHDGRFVVPGWSGAASLNPDVVFSLDDPLAYVRDELSTGTDPSCSPTAEAVVFVPGPNTPLAERMSAAPASPTRLEYYAGVLGLNMAQIHAASERDRGDIVLRGEAAAEMARQLDRHNLVETAEERGGRGCLSAFGKEESRTDTLVLDATCRDEAKMIRNELLSGGGRGRHPSLSSPRELPTPAPELQRTIRKLVDCAVAAVQKLDTKEEAGRSRSSDEDEEAPAPAPAPSSPSSLVVMTYSSSTVDVAAALRDWKETAARVMSESQSEDLLRRAVTVVTVGSVSDTFPDGPAYLHVSMSDDPVVSALGGCTSGNRAGGGADAVYLHAFSPYYARPTGDGRRFACADAHNMAACAAQFLAVLLRVNGTRTLRGLYDLASRPITYDINPLTFAVAAPSTAMDIPPNLEDEVLPATIRATGGERWLWDAVASLGGGEGGSAGGTGGGIGWEDVGALVDGPDSPIPSKDEADAILGWQYGYDAYDDTAAACGAGVYAAGNEHDA